KVKNFIEHYYEKTGNPKDRIHKGEVVNHFNSIVADKNNKVNCGFLLTHIKHLGFKYDRYARTKGQRSCILGIKLKENDEDALGLEEEENEVEQKDNSDEFTKIEDQETYLTNLAKELAPIVVEDSTIEQPVVGVQVDLDVMAEIEKPIGTDKCFYCGRSKVMMISRSIVDTFLLPKYSNKGLSVCNPCSRKIEAISNKNPERCLQDAAIDFDFYVKLSPA